MSKFYKSNFFVRIHIVLYCMCVTGALLQNVARWSACDVRVYRCYPSPGSLSRNLTSSGQRHQWHQLSSLTTVILILGEEWSLCFVSQHKLKLSYFSARLLLSRQSFMIAKESKDSTLESRVWILLGTGHLKTGWKVSSNNVDYWCRNCDLNINHWGPIFIIYYWGQTVTITKTNLGLK